MSCATALFLMGCSSDDEVNNAPEIEFVSLSDSEVVAFEDPLSIKISYFDADGDLGENNADIKNCYIKDSRNDVIYEYRIPELAPNGEEIRIQGELSVLLQSLAITDGASSESATFEIYVIDRAGNESNRISTNTVTISSN